MLFAVDASSGVAPGRPWTLAADVSGFSVTAHAWQAWRPSALLLAVLSVDLHDHGDERQRQQRLYQRHRHQYHHILSL